MTFYNIIFGLLFIGTFREVMVALMLPAGPNWPLFALAATLAVLVFSDTIYTAVVIEGKKFSYSMTMKLLDLWSFILLSFAVMVLNPDKNDMFEIDARDAMTRVELATGWSAEALLWGLLTVYVLNLVVWNHLMGVGMVQGRYRWVRWVQPLQALAFGVMAVLAWQKALPEAAMQGLRWVMLAGVVVYLLRFKTYMSQVLDDVVRLQPLTAVDVSAIHKWPHYQPPIDALDYALRPGGWLDQYPECPTNLRYGVWQNGKLVGFTLLVDIADNDAEFYIALHAGYRRRNIGRDAAEQTLHLGFAEHGLARIHLKVRSWYGARRLYADIGFSECGVVEEQVQGQPVKFILMEKLRPA
ncbi:MAG: GNAT family N-acetyltransferase [Burkholderiales bacterium]